MIFEEMFERTDVIEGDTSFSSIALEQRWRNISPGVYNNGLLTICNNDLPKNTLDNWTWLTGQNSLILGYLAWGDYIYISFDDKKIYLVICQEGGKVCLGDNLESVFDYNLCNHNFLENVVLIQKFQLMQEKLGALKYGSCYVHQPYLMIGEEEDDDKYSVKDFLVYIDILGQTWKQIKETPAKNREQP